MRTSETLTAAKVRLVRYGWHQGGGAVSVCKPTCVSDAIFEAGDCAYAAYYPAQDLFMRVTTGSLKLSALYDWNDAPERTLQDVLDAFDAAIAIAQQQEQATEAALVPAGAVAD